ncbi:MFS transporter [Streptomyces zhihengii]|uniref:MFS transporter n=1 Tax=Streptomyces zhihengii TaxID=1818004 RepID=UPI003451906E
MSAGTPGRPPGDTPATPPAAPAPGAPGAPTPSVRAVVGLLVLFEVMSGFLQMGMVPLLPKIGDRLGVTDSDLSWVIAVQLLAAAVCVPAFGRLGDLYGHRRLLRASLVSVAAGTLLVALAPSFEVLLLGRVLQGPLAALLPLEIALVRDRLPVEAARRAIALLVGALTVGSLLGGVLMGAADAVLGDIRLTLLLPAVLCVPVAFLRIPESRRPSGGRIDLPGLLLLGTAMISLLLGVSSAEEHGWTTASVLLPLAVGAALLAAFAAVELRSAEPLLDLRAMRGRQSAPFYLAAFLFGVFFFGSQAPNSTFWAADPDETGYGFALSALSISLMALPGAVFSVVGSLLTDRIAARAGYRTSLVGAFTVAALSFCSFALLHDVWWHMSVTYAFLGFAVGLALGAMPTVIVEASEVSRSGIATAVYNNVKTLGGAVAGGVFATILGSLPLPGGRVPGERAYVVLWLTGAACALCAAVAVAAARREEGAPAPAPGSCPQAAHDVVPGG